MREVRSALSASRRFNNLEFVRIAYLRAAELFTDPDRQLEPRGSDNCRFIVVNDKTWGKKETVVNAVSTLPRASECVKRQCG